MQLVLLNQRALWLKIMAFDLLKPIYSKTAAYGHFGREDQGFTWELTNQVEKLKELCL